VKEERWHEAIEMLASMVDQQSFSDDGEEPTEGGIEEC